MKSRKVMSLMTVDSPVPAAAAAAADDDDDDDDDGNMLTMMCYHAVSKFLRYNYKAFVKTSLTQNLLVISVGSTQLFTSR